MTEIDPEHSLMLRAVAHNTSDLTAQRAYSDFLQERGNPGWMIVASYPISDWPVWVTGKTGWWTERVGQVCTEVWKLPWLPGAVRFDKWVKQPRSRIKQILIAYADGRVVE